MKRGIRRAALTLAACMTLSCLSGGAISAEASTVSHPSKYSTYIVEEGMDVSIWNGIINWLKVKQAGTDFAFIRVGGVYYNSGVYYEDEIFKRNIEGAETAGVDAGIYFYSQAISVEEAVKEAEYVLELLEGRQLQMPVVFDFEYAGSGMEGRLYNAHLTAREQTNICMAFCETIEAAGYDAMVYANAYMLWHRLYGNEIQEKYGVWLAEYHWNGATAKYLGEYDIWQYTQYGSAEGVSGYADLNYRYIKPELSIKEEWNRRMMLSWNEDRNCSGYNIYRKEWDSNEEFVCIGTTEGSNSTSWVDIDVKRGSKYIYKVIPYVIGADGMSREISTVYGPLEAEVTRGYWVNGEYSS